MEAHVLLGEFRGDVGIGVAGLEVEQRDAGRIVEPDDVDCPRNHYLLGGLESGRSERGGIASRGSTVRFGMQQTRPSQATEKLVIAMAGGCCSYPDCGARLIVGPPHERRFIGQIAHIESPSPLGPRGRPSEDAHKHGNLLILCPTHHAEVDGTQSQWSPERLREMKVMHEAAIAENHGWSRWEPSYIAVHYLNVPRIAWLAAEYGNSCPGPPGGGSPRLVWSWSATCTMPRWFSSV